MKTQKDVYVDNMMNGVEWAFNSNIKDVSGVDRIEVIESFIFRLNIFITENKNQAIKDAFGKDFTPEQVAVLINASKELYPEQIEDFNNLEQIILNK